MDSLSIFLIYFTVCLCELFTGTTATDTLAVNQTIRDGQTIVSPQETFELGFFSPINTSQNRYLGIWYKRLATGTVVWVANRETPIANKSGQLTLQRDGVLVLRDSTNRSIWSSNSPGNTRNPVARLLNNGNLMVIGVADAPENYIWQSFDHPGNTMLPQMKFGRDLVRGVLSNFTSWKSADDPSQGQYMIYMDFNGFPQTFQKNAEGIQYRLGSWNGLAYSGNTNNKPNPTYRNWFIFNERETSAVYNLINTSVLTMIQLSPEGNIGQWNWINRSQGWFLYSSLTTDSCERYGLCGVYGSCDISQSPNCGCLRGFTPKRPYQWNMADWTSGCRREIPLDCGVGEAFRRYSFMKLPDTRQSWFDRNMTPEQCQMKCKNECNFTAYAILDIKYGTGCMLWHNELIDMRILPGNGQDIYIRMAAVELEKDRSDSGSKTKVWIVVVPIVVGLVILLGFCVLIVRKWKLKAQGRRSPNQEEVLDLPLFSLSTMAVATNNFSICNKLGEGGFGPVYKGILEDGQESAVKRLSMSSSQGVVEFKNEVIFISELQHRNLVKILGCCIEEEEKMLVYEYMPNKGLDLFLFHETKSKMLDWPLRFYIINGIARGLLYLHLDSRLRIIHRDLKAANVLLDHDMNPKISDFGLARSFGGNDTETNTKRVVGTYGYMSPEYAGHGIFSTKSDVFSFSVLILEIVSGKKNRGFFHVDHSHNLLLGHAWRLYKEGKTLELVDVSFFESGHTFEMLRSIQVGLLCVQHNPDDRPNMSAVVMMLSGDGKLPEPKQPGFYIEINNEDSSSMKTNSSCNDATDTLLEGR